VATPIVVLYSQGYRFDFNSRKIVRTGGFYFKAWPKNANIYLDEEFKKTTDFFFGATMIENLLPKEYGVQIKKKGFYSWEKNLQIEEKKVTEIKNVFLIPENPTLSNVMDNIDSFWQSPDGNKIILKESKDNGWILKILDLENDTQTDLLKENDLKEEELQILSLEFSPDSRRILLKVKENKTEKYFIVQLEERVIIDLTLSILTKEEIKKVSFNPRDQDKIFFNTEEGLFEYNLSTKETDQISGDLITYEVSNRDIVFLSSDGFLFQSDFSGQRREKLNQESFPLDNTAQYQIKLKGKEILLLKNEVLYFFNQDSEKFEKLSDGVKSLEISPDGKKMFFSSDREIWIFFLEDIQEQPPRNAKDKIFLTRFSEEIKEVSWYTSHYLIFCVGSKIKIAEIDDRDRINIVDLVEFPESEIFFNNRDKKLYILQEGNLFISEALLP
jgi:WD40 repeat protein